MDPGVKEGSSDGPIRPSVSLSMALMAKSSAVRFFVLLFAAGSGIAACFFALDTVALFGRGGALTSADLTAVTRWAATLLAFFFF